MKRHVETRSRAKTLRSEMSPVQAKLWAVLRGNRVGVKFQREVVLHPYIADFASRSERLVIEVDGDSHANTAAYDAARSASLEQRGWRVIRFTNHEVLTNLEGVTRAILIALGRDPESPHPLQGEREGARASGRKGEGGRSEPLQRPANRTVAPLSPTLSP